MSMTKSELKQAIRLGALNHLNDIKVNEDDRFHVFSDDFTIKMKKLIKKQQLLSWRITNTATKKIAVILTSLILVISLTSVKSTGQTMLHFIVQKCEDYYKVIFKGDSKKIITKEFKVNYIPEDFKIISYDKSDFYISTQYKNSQEEIIAFMQSLSSTNNSFVIDNEHGTIQTLNINDLTIELYSKDNIYQAFWVNDSCFFTLFINSNIPQEEVIRIIESIE